MKKYALISTYNKKNLEFLCKAFKNNNIEIIATSSTAKYISEKGFKSYSVSKFTKFKEILDGRVKTLQPKIHASILYDRKNKKHKKTFKELNFPSIDYVIVNLYPFGESKNKNNINMIDIGGISLLRSAAKNYKNVSTMCDITDYDEFVKILNKGKGLINLNFRKKMASKAFALSSKYDSKISQWMGSKNIKFTKFNDKKRKKLRYGENPHQSAVFYKSDNKNYSLYNNIIKEGKKISYNNLLDIDAAFNLINEFKNPTCAIIKHNNPCGVSSNKKIYNAISNAYSCDPTSSFGGILAINRNVDEKITNLLINKFFEIIIAKDFTLKSIKILSKKKGLTLIKTKNIKVKYNDEIKSINDGYLIQKKDKIKLSRSHIKCVSKKYGSKKMIEDLIFAFKVCKHVKSNAIVLVKNMKTIGIGAGQMSRLDSTKIALKKINIKNKKLNFIAASDAFFPFLDNLKLLIKSKCNGIIQPNGSINDNKIIDYANKKKIVLFFSKYRFFKH